MLLTDTKIDDLALACYNSNSLGISQIWSQQRQNE